MKPLFIPLKAEFYWAFLDGSKDTEFRRHGPRWNAKTCPVGRPVILSLGYGKKNRMTGKVVRFFTQVMDTPDWIKCYGSPDRAACIEIKLDERRTKH